MIPDIDATNHHIYRTEVYDLTGLPLYDLDAELNSKAQSGWRVDQIVKWSDTQLLVIYIGFLPQSEVNEWTVSTR